MKVKVKFEGIEGMRKALNSDIKKAKIRQAVMYNTAELNQKAQMLCPVDTGTLRRGIKSTITDNGFTGEVKDEVDYAPYIEYGTRYMEAQPFFKPALEAQKDKFKNDLIKAIGD